ncbi:MAG TPA: FAD-dependent oxidoreductase, partial [Desulfotomaculum sp.]|nr:FAD-dependent oxidoreductase [Desulfotomaculum sp.]
MKTNRLFQPIKINNVELKNRLVMPAMVTCFGNRDNTVSERLIAYHAARAKGGFGLNIVENFAVHPEGKAFKEVLGLWDDKFIPGSRNLTDAVHRNGGKIFAQIYHAGSQTTEEVIGTQPVAPSAFLHPFLGTLPRELSPVEIEEIIEAFGIAALRSREAGFDGVEVHGSHGYLVAEFMSPYTNRRTDEYGGDLLGRMRFPVEIIKSIRWRVGKDFPVIIRIAGDERVSEGRTLEESRVVARILEEAGYDGLHVTTATTATMPYIAPPYYAPPALNTTYAEVIKKCVTIPVITTGRINDPLIAECILAEGRADLVGMGRASIADPDLPKKLAAGLIEDIRPCVGCLQGCIGNIYFNRPITCLANPEVGREEEMVLSPAVKVKKVLVVGGGPAGLEAARVAARRGHRVILCEKNGKLGGQLNLAAVPPHKQGMAQLVKYMVTQVRKARVEVCLNTEVGLELIKRISPDMVIVATGG